MEAILHPDTTAPVGDRIERALAAGDTAEAEQILSAARDRVANRYRTFERDVNALEIDPAFTPSQQALARLGARP